MSALTINRQDHLIASIPYLLGFEPEDSHVIVWLNEDGGVVLVQRTNLADADDPRITDAGASHGFPRAICITFSHSRPEHFSDLHYDIAEALEESGVEVRDLLHYSKGLYWSYFTPREGMIADPGTEITDEVLDIVRSRFALEGIAAMPSRNALIDEVTPSSGTAHKYGAAKRYWREFRDECGVVDARYEALAYAHSVTVQHDNTEQDYLRVAAALEDVNLRDAIIWHMAQMDNEELREVYKMIASVCRVTPASKSAPILSLAAVCAYMSGNGAAANVCVEIALANDRDYSFAQYAEHIFALGLNPVQFRQLVSELRVDEIMSKEG